MMTLSLEREMRLTTPMAAVIWTGLVLVGCYDLGIEPPRDAGSADTDSDTDSDTDTGTDGECIRYVDVDAAGSANGLTWADACNAVQPAIDSAAEAVANIPAVEHCKVWVAAGIYFIYQLGPNDTVALATDVEVYGGFAGDETALDDRDWEANVTVLDGRNEAMPDMRVHHVVTGADASLLDGFVVAHGTANNEPSDLYGGGFYSNDSSVEIHNCKFIGNYAQNAGAAIAFAEGTLTLSNSLFTLNTSNTEGAAVNVNPGTVDISDCYFVGNLNEGDTGGGALGMIETTGQVINGVFAGNSTGGSGGAILGSGAQLVNLTVVDNAAGAGGGLHAGMTTAAFNSIFWGNLPDQIGSAPAIEYSDVQDGYGGAGNIQGDPLFVGYPLVSGDWSGIDYDDTNYQTSLTDEGAGWGPNALAGLFVKPDATGDDRWVRIVSNSSTELVVWGDVTGFVDDEDSYEIYDLHLAAGSPCIDAADGDPATDFDLDDNERVNDTDTPDTGTGTPDYVDMGAFEYQP
jgi:hypothetical protein